jgi:hypothetical protein
MLLEAAVARRRLGELLGGDQGRELVRDADDWLAEQGVRDPVRTAAMHAPGPRPEPKCDTHEEPPAAPPGAMGREDDRR